MFSCRVLLRQPRHIRRPLVQPTPFQKYGSEEEKRKLRHLEDATLPPPEAWEPKPGGIAVMPRKWKEDGFGLYLCSLSPNKLEDWAIKRLRPEVDKATQQDGGFIMTEENFKKLMFKRSTLKKAILDGAEIAFGVPIPTHHRKIIMSVQNLLEWLAQRVEIARPVPTYDIPKEVDTFLEVFNNKMLQKAKDDGKQWQKIWQDQTYNMYTEKYKWDLQ